jgi:hypothetical protein
MIYNGAHISVRIYAAWGYFKALGTYSRISRPCFPRLKADSTIRVWNCQELGDFAMCDDFMIWFIEDVHRSRVSNKTSNSIFRKALFFSNLVKDDVPYRGYHIRDFVAAYSVDSN